MNRCGTMALLLVALTGQAVADEIWQERFAALDWLTKRCWIGTFPDGETTDQHCFSYQYTDKFIRDVHVVRGEGPTYRGETLYAWDPAGDKLVYWYWTNRGSFSTGEVEPQADGALHFPEQHIAEDGTTKEMRNVWRYNGSDRYVATLEEKRADQWAVVWEIEYVDIRRHRSADLAALAGTGGIAYNAYVDDAYNVHLLMPDGVVKPLTEGPTTDWVYGGGATLDLLSRRDRPGGARGYHLYELGRDGLARKAIEHVVPDSTVGRGPDGDYVVAMSDGADHELYRVRAGSADRQALTDNACEDTNPDWSPDGAWIVYRSNCGGAMDLWRMRLADGHRQQLTHDPANDDELGYGGEGPPRYSPDGGHIAWMTHDGDWELATMEANGDAPRRLTDNDVNDTFPAWSPDATRIAFSSDRDGNDEIYVLDLRSGRTARLTYTPEPEQAPVWLTPTDVQASREPDTM